MDRSKVSVWCSPQAWALVDRSKVSVWCSPQAWALVDRSKVSMWCSPQAWALVDRSKVRGVHPKHGYWWTGLKLVCGVHQHGHWLTGLKLVCGVHPKHGHWWTGLKLVCGVHPKHGHWWIGPRSLCAVYQIDGEWLCGPSSASDGKVGEHHRSPPSGTLRHDRDWHGSHQPLVRTPYTRYSGWLHFLCLIYCLALTNPLSGPRIPGTVGGCTSCV